MAKYPAARLKDKRQDIVAVVVNRDFVSLTPDEQKAICARLQEAAAAAGLPGTVVPVWEAAGGKVGFLAPEPLQPFFQNLTLLKVVAGISAHLEAG